MELQLQDSAGSSAERVDISDAVFASAFNEPLVHQVVTAYASARRAGTKAQKSRADVRGGGSKPWRQKGTGRARAGSIRSPIWRGGGVTFAASPRRFSLKVNRKMYRGALRAILSELMRQQRLQIISELAPEQARTKALKAALARFGVHDVLIVNAEVSRELYLAARNLPRVDVTDVQALDPLSLVAHESVLVSVDAVRRIEDWLG